MNVGHGVTTSWALGHILRRRCDLLKPSWFVRVDGHSISVGRAASHSPASLGVNAFCSLSGPESQVSSPKEVSWLVDMKRSIFLPNHVIAIQKQDPREFRCQDGSSSDGNRLSRVMLEPPEKRGAGRGGVSLGGSLGLTFKEVLNGSTSRDQKSKIKE